MRSLVVYTGTCLIFACCAASSIAATPTPTPRPFEDLLLLARWWESASNETSLRVNLVHDGLIDDQDLLAMIAAWRFTPTPTQTWTPTSTPTPSPTPAGDVVIIDIPGLPEDATPLTLIRIPAGSFMMGRYPGEKDSYPNADPQHQVNIGYDFYIGKYELTKAQWQSLVGTTPWQGQSYVLDDPNSPAIYVSWNDIRNANGLLDKLNALGQGTFRLPSEAEWEYACRAGTTTRFYWGDDPDYTQIGDYAWYDDNAWNVNQVYAHIVGLKLPNAFGLHDMSGNVWEWCEDWWNGNYNGAPADGSAWTTGNASYRVFRGGDFGGRPYRCRSAYRNLDGLPAHRYLSIGVRVVWTP